MDPTAHATQLLIHDEKDERPRSEPHPRGKESLEEPSDAALRRHGLQAAEHRPARPRHQHRLRAVDLRGAEVTLCAVWWSYCRGQAESPCGRARISVREMRISGREMHRRRRGGGHEASEGRGERVSDDAVAEAETEQPALRRWRNVPFACAGHVRASMLGRGVLTLAESYVASSAAFMMMERWIDGAQPTHSAPTPEVRAMSSSASPTPPLSMPA